MKKLFSLTKTLVVTLLQREILSNALTRALGASWFIALAAQITVPFYPVPMTMQSFAIALVALMTTWPTALSAVLLYLSYAALGIPVLAGGASGLSVLTGATAGYLAGFVWMSGVIAALTQRYRYSGALARFGFTLVGSVFLFAPGLCWLAHLFGWQVAFKTGLLPFVFSEPIKLALAAYLSVFIRDRYQHESFLV